MNYYQTVDPNCIINPFDDLDKTWVELLDKARNLPGEAPPMLSTLMCNLAFEIEYNRRNTLAIQNPDYFDPIELPIFIRHKDAKGHLEKEQIIELIRRAGWEVNTDKSCYILELSMPQPVATTNG